MKKLFANIIEFLLSKKFYGPIIYFIVGVLSIKIINNIIDRILKTRHKKGKHKKEDTVIKLIKNVIKYVIIIIVILLILEVYGINTSNIIASLGIAGAVLGLALQDTIKNMLSGILIIFDNRYNVGDYVKINDFTGEVISLGLQTTKIKSYYGEIYTVSNSSITTITNLSEENSNLVIDLPVSYNTDIDLLEKTLKKLNKEIVKMDNVIEDMKLLGIEEFASSQINYRISILCKPYTQFQIKRDIFKLIKKEFDKSGIEIPYNQIDVHIKEN